MTSVKTMLSRNLSASRSVVSMTCRAMSSAADTKRYNMLSENVNAQYVSDDRAPPAAATKTPPKAGVSRSHWEEHWDADTLRSSAGDHVIATWGPTGPVSSLPILERADGLYVYDSNGKEYLDWTSQAFCSNLGHTVPPAISAAVQKQMDTMPMAYGGLGLVEVRVRLAQLLSELCPGDLNGFVFPSGVV